MIQNKKISKYHIISEDDILQWINFFEESYIINERPYEWNRNIKKSYLISIKYNIEIDFKSDNSSVTDFNIYQYNNGFYNKKYIKFYKNPGVYSLIVENNDSTMVLDYFEESFIINELDKFILSISEDYKSIIRDRKLSELDLG
jgi:hypothetical protein